MPKLREALKQSTGPDAFGNEVTLTETDIQPYITNPEIAQMEADVTQARYGGSPIQESQTEAGGSMAQTAAAPKKGPIDLSRRGDFENAVFNQLKSDLMPDGNPFALNTNAKMNEISKTDLPELFQSIFRGQVAWQDRHLLDDDQKKFWQSEVKRYRAHIQQALDAEKANAVSMYNQMMNQFDNAAKEQEVIRKRERQQRQDVAKRMETRGKTQEAQLRRRSELLTGIREMTEMVLALGKNADPREVKALMNELQGKRDELKFINAALGIVQEAKPKEGGPQKVSSEGEPKGKEKEGKRAKPMVVRKKIPGQQGEAVVRKKIPQEGERTVVQYKIIKSGPNKGRKVLKYSDGSTAYADETDQ